MVSQPSLPQLLKSATEHFQRRSFAECARLCQIVLAQHGEEANALLLLGLMRLAVQDGPGAIAFLERARRKNPAHVHVLNNLGNAYRAAGRLAEARSCLEEAVRQDPGFVAGHNNLGNVLLDLEQRNAARTSYAKALALQPTHADAAANLARLAEEGHALDEAAGLAGRALAASPAHLQARMTLARVLQREGHTDDALKQFEGLVAEPGLRPNMRVAIHGHMGECMDRLGRYADAFDQFTSANELQRAQFAGQYAGDTGFLSASLVARLSDLITKRPASTWTPAPPSEHSPVFLVGFPRSGTTLLDQILSSHPDVTVLEERDTLAPVCARLFPGAGDASFLADLSATQIEQLRQLYWERVYDRLMRNAIRKIFVDKLPLNAALLPLIYRLFPEARIVLALRDPRDVVLSCFQQRFGMNGAMYQLLRTDTAAAYYAAVMSLVDQSRRLLPLQMHQIRYEDVVAQFEVQIGSLLAFLDLPWDDAVRNHTETARRRVINTPSATQVVRPLYTSSVGKWRQYEPQLAPVLGALEPWVAAFGYAD
jgi:cytochrome c-type biogenesis protein CcmH/NrfG